ncbi:alpha/beta hydrolase [Thalassotalea sp. Y01]|uniref:alpha/beta hydrolase n=1 Tax=Thalassotalea sp. Y01 TaxID=2729613 RepID=UPI00145D16BC|nr:alpha/beta hydrolase [Thalassotalea sp. Y01]NMP16334.1 alpha/beta hydrolase [Thalassotalea sp. Y01]
MRCKQMLVLLLLSMCGLVHAGNTYDTFPQTINAADKYVFYSHGYIVEGANSTPRHKEWGVYDFPLIKQQLKDDDYHLIAYHRAAHTDPFEHAKLLAQDVNRLITAGVDAENITLLGFSRGGAISILTANELKSDKVNTIILAGCAGLIKHNADVQVYGAVFSIFETSDKVGSCDFLVQRSDNVSSFTEISISTGKSHGAFYLPRDEWLQPVKRWIKASDTKHNKG